MINSLNKKTIYYLAFLLLVINALMYFIFIPDIQKKANSHSAKGDFVSILIFLIGFISLIISLIILLLFKKRKLGYILLIISINLFLWTPVIFSIKCKGCAIA